jgi:predicted MFS family arabinose efflux permease
MISIPGIFITVRINSRIGVKHTIFLRAPILIGYLLTAMQIPAYTVLFYPSALLGGLSLIMYWTSMNIEYVRTSDKRKEGEEAGLLVGLPYLSVVIGPVIGATILTIFGFTVLFLSAFVIIIISVIPLFLSSDYKADPYPIRTVNHFMDKKRALWYFIIGATYVADFFFWSLYVSLKFGFISLGIAASLMGLGMVIFTLLIGRRSNTLRGRRRTIKVAGFLGLVMWLLRAVAVTEIEFFLLSLFGGFVISSLVVSLYADFSRFAKENGPVRSVVFREMWISLGRIITITVLVGLIPFIAVDSLLPSYFVMLAVLTSLLMFFKE